MANDAVCGQSSGFRAQALGDFNSKRLRILAKFQFISFSILLTLLFAGCDTSNVDVIGSGNDGEAVSVNLDAPWLVSPPIRVIHGDAVTPSQQKNLGLVTIHNERNTPIQSSTGRNCSATLLNRYWVLTARHCVDDNASGWGSLVNPYELRLAVAWDTNISVRATRIRDLGTSSARPDIALVFLGGGDFGPMPNQPIYTGNNGRVAASDTITQYGQGYSTFASGVYGTPSAQRSDGRGVYRTAQYNPLSTDEGEFRVLPNARGQAPIGGDSGGPAFVTVNGVHAGIAGVASWARFSGLIPGTPSGVYLWEWATGVADAVFASTERFIAEIASAIQEVPPPPPPPPPVPYSWLPAVLDFILD